jgi:hypothetical protein
MRKIRNGFVPWFLQMTSFALPVLNEGFFAAIGEQGRSSKKEEV